MIETDGGIRYGDDKPVVVEDSEILELMRKAMKRESDGLGKKFDYKSFMEVNRGNPNCLNCSG